MVNARKPRLVAWFPITDSFRVFLYLAHTPVSRCNSPSRSLDKHSMAYNTPGALPPGTYASYKDTGAVPVAAPVAVLPKLIVSGLPPMWRPQQVSSFLEQYGDIEDCGVVAPGRAFIRYRSAESTVRAYEKVPSMAPLQLPTGTYKLSAQLDDSDSKASVAPAAAPLLSAPSPLPQPVAPAKRTADVASFLPPAKQPRVTGASLPTNTPENNKGNFLNIIHSLGNSTPARDASSGVGAPIGGAPGLVSQPAPLGALAFPTAPAASAQPSSNVNLQKQLVQNLAESFLEGKLPPSLAEGLRAHLQGGGVNPLPAPVPAVAPVAPQPVSAAYSADSSLQALLKLTQGKATPAVQAELQKLQQQPKPPAPVQVQPVRQPQVPRPAVAQAPPAALKTTEDSRQDVLQVLQALAASTDTSGGLKKLLVPEVPVKKTATSRPEGPDAVYVVMKSKCHDFLQASVEHELWYGFLFCKHLHLSYL